MKFQKVIRRASADGTSVLNAAVAANIGEPGGSAKAEAGSIQHVEIVQRRSAAPARRGPTDGARQRPTDKES